MARPDSSADGHLRSARWFAPRDLPGFVHRSALRAEGFSPAAFAGKPVVGICNSSSELVNCNFHLSAVANAVRRGVLAAGGLPLEFSTISLGEQLMKPTTMLYRNLMAMDVEECLRAYPLDSVVLLAGCDKTIPAQLMGAISADMPAVMVTGGPAAPAVFRGRELGVGTDLWRYTDDLRAGRMTEAEYADLEAAAGPSVGHCPEMGTASTMATLVEALGMSLPGSAGPPAVDARRYAVAEAAGRRAVSLATEHLRPSRILTPAAFDNAITTLLAVGGSSNAVVHLLALAGRASVELDLSRFDELARVTPLLVNVRPAGEHLFERVFHAGGVPAVLYELSALLDLRCITVTGRPLGSTLPDEPTTDRDVISTLEDPVKPAGGLAVVRGSLAPRGALVKRSAASERLMRHTGTAVVFENMEDLSNRIDDPDLEVDTESVLILRNAGPVGAPGMPEWGQIPIPAKLLRKGVDDMVRISDARMSGTAFGTAVLHVVPEGALRGPLAVVRSGDRIELDVPARRLDLAVPPEELDRRLASWQPAPPKFTRGYGAMYLRHVLQADEGCDFDFLRGRSEEPAEEPLGMLQGWIGGW